MSTQALLQGGLRPIECLPPTLQPNAIASVAPHTDRRLSFLVSCIIYAGFASVLAWAAQHKDQIAQFRPFTTGPSIVLDPTDTVPEPPVAVQPIPAPVVAPMAHITPSVEPPPVLQNTVPDQTPNVLPQIDNSHTSIRETNPTPNLTGISNSFGPSIDRPGSNYGTSSAGTVMEVDFRNVQILKQVPPNYPPLARLAHVQGSVELRMTIDAQGIPSDVQVMSSSHVSLEAEAIRAARQWRFAPALSEGRPVASRFILTMNFRLK